MQATTKITWEAIMTKSRDMTSEFALLGQDLEESVCEDVKKLRESPLVAKNIPIVGLIYHVEVRIDFAV